MSVSDSDSDLIETLFSQPDSDGSFPPNQLWTLRQLSAKRRAVVLAFPPKAAGTFLRTAVIKAVDGQLVRIVHAQGGRDATPYLPTLVRYFEGKLTDKTLVTHVHMLALPANLHLLAAFDIKPIIIKRSIPDMLASYWDMLESDDNALLHGLNCHIPPGFRNLPRNAKADFIIDVLGPWYANFYAGWLTYAAASPQGVCVIDYQSVQADPAGVVERCLAHAGAPVSRARCEAAVEYAWTRREALRFNKGEIGRGEAYFRPPQLNRLARILGHYPDLAPYRQELLATGRPLRKRSA